MKISVLGVQKVDFPDKRTGERVTLAKLHCSYYDDFVKGLKVEQINISANSPVYGMALDIVPPCEINAELNRRGGIVDFEVLS